MRAALTPCRPGEGLLQESKPEEEAAYTRAGQKVETEIDVFTEG